VPKEELDVQALSLTSNRPFVQEILSNTFIFQGLSLDQLNVVAAALGPPQTIATGSILMRRGDKGASSMFVLQSGTCSVLQPELSSSVSSSSNSPHEGIVGEREVMHLGPGSVIGEISLLTGCPRTATVMAVEECVVFEMTKERFVRLLNENQTIRLHIMFIADRRNRENERFNRTHLSP